MTSTYLQVILICLASVFIKFWHPTTEVHVQIFVIVNLKVHSVSFKVKIGIKEGI